MSVTVDRTMVGQEFDHTVFEPVTAEQMLEYARAYGETNPHFVDEVAAARGPHGGLIACPTFVFRLRGKHFMPRQMHAFGRNSFDAGKDIELGVPVRPGDVLTGSSTVHDVYEKTGRSGTMVFIVFRTTLTNQRGEMVAVVDQKMMSR
jgi:acyl dehydratase